MQKTLEKELGVAMKAMIKTLLNDSLKHLAQQGNYNGTLLKVRCVKGQLGGANNVKNSSKLNWKNGSSVGASCDLNGKSMKIKRCHLPEVGSSFALDLSLLSFFMKFVF